jgi:probable addiction module antidote protein
MKEFDPKQLRDNPDLIACFLSSAFETDDLPTILGALRDTLRVHNVSAVSRATGLQRPALYKTFDGTIEPDFARILKLLEGFGVQLTVKKRMVALPKPPLPKLGRPPKAPKG